MTGTRNSRYNPVSTQRNVASNVKPSAISGPSGPPGPSGPSGPSSSRRFEKDAMSHQSSSSMHSIDEILSTSSRSENSGKSVELGSPFANADLKRGLEEDLDHPASGATDIDPGPSITSSPEPKRSRVDTEDNEKQVRESTETMYGAAPTPENSCTERDGQIRRLHSVMHEMSRVAESMRRLRECIEFIKSRVRDIEDGVLKFDPAWAWGEYLVAGQNASEQPRAWLD
ncbi:hypothetical protein AUEXF2481DRAFT_4225 [Aureobasidium subglaciale EXF-2481]|uniref:Uncharacterized protein n=1 Tax=Aureobasidium subglaciale (strain EXF-2481) TaxID=1043005 RepID=A0A074YPE9_AURSE|nr:uncharacterized protein AUEXF2481DRAFT_4225 [Aureobasidium subglaciale EXF-2481]KAI5219129.1 hypothetical protein E4T40_06568 [Aureobasidium subglaciale]KAI5260024.1 hypothetical protein E4T46_06368 [Aureobasidium subglaciale]KEQ95962.1 hypothetical protein AUEXF2481DRAFT_4225 [Aureobasidium subglaciale EXF-2481]